MSKIYCDSIELVSAVDSSSNICVWVIHADKIPPHIGLSQGGEFFSLKSNGVDIAADVDSLEQVLGKREITTLVYELDETSTKLSEIFSGYETTIPSEITCLNPIKRILGITKAERIHDLLKVLQEQSRIIRCMGLHIDEKFTGIPEYEISEIHSRLKKLDAKKG